jgi:hypothetical protein
VWIAVNALELVNSVGGRALDSAMVFAVHEDRTALGRVAKVAEGAYIARKSAPAIPT